MTFELSHHVAIQLQDLASTEGRDVNVLVEEAIAAYLESMAITDLDADMIGETQIGLTAELDTIADWQDGGA